MLKPNFTKDVESFLKKADRKHAGQIALKILALLSDPNAADVKPLNGKLKNYFRADSGEYRIIFFVEDDELRIVLIGKRNGDEVYKTLAQK